MSSNVQALEPLLTVDEVCALLRIKRTKLHQLVRTKALACVKVGRCLRFRAGAVKAFIEGAEVQPAGAVLRRLV